ncbi:MAG: signal peptide peptidase SppA [Patescibacteria group bacterium]|nr:signal peptide peptidase SppA [Patescibacteria group bacterium]
MFKKLKQILPCSIFKFQINYSRFNPKNYNWRKVKEFLKIFNLALFAVFIIIMIFYDSSIEESNEEIAYNVSDNIINHLDEYYFTPEDKKNNCNISVIKLHGYLITYIQNENLECSYGECQQIADETSSENIISEIKKAEKDNNIKAIILEIDSCGGYPVAAEEVANALKKAKKPTVALIREYGDSAAYYAATGADIIFASKNSDVGSIGVTMSYLDNVKKNQKDGLTYNQLSSGKYKDAFDHNKSLTADEKQLIMRDVKIIHENFIKDVAENRNLDIEKVRKLADGSSMLGQMALENGLIDKIGGIDEVEEYLKEKINKDIKICW